MSNKINSILILFILTVPLTATYTWLQYQKKAVKREVKWKLIAGLDKEELVLLKFTEKDKKTKLHWKHSKEFEYEQEMYDIVETLVIGDSTYYWCWWDNKETLLNQQLASLVGYSLSKDSQQKKKIQELVVYLKTLYCTSLTNFEALDNDNITTMLASKNAHFGQEKFLHAPYLTIHAPPPQLL